MTQAQYAVESTVQDGVQLVKLHDRARQTTVTIAPHLGNNAFEMTVRGKNLFWVPFKSPAEIRTRPTFFGNPFLAPWANRLDQDGFYANGRKFVLNPALGSYRSDGNKQPIHGLLAYATEWRVVESSASDNGAQLVSRIEFWRRPDWMAQFPFAHNIEMIHRLRDGVLEIETTLENLSSEPMPVSIGFHPYFKLDDAPRDEWKVTLPAAEQIVLSKTLVPTGERRANPYGMEPVALKGIALDDVFTGLRRDGQGIAEFAVQGKQQKIMVRYDDKYPVAVVYAPPGRGFICFEPMSGPTNAFNLHHEGKWPALPVVPAGGKWTARFWVAGSGF